ncbi:MAG TPA: hypothetical protein VNM92_04665 [Thermoanaerobaculia bacterium]|nr:hypothetical protein [Thermoanaerobaculia bacterium]
MIELSDGAAIFDPFLEVSNPGGTTPLTSVRRSYAEMTFITRASR